MLMGKMCPCVAVTRIVFSNSSLEMVSANVLTDDHEKLPIVYRTRKGPIASNVVLSCRLDRGDIARRFYNSSPSSDEVYRGRIGGPACSELENPLPLVRALLPLAGGLTVG